MCACVHATYIVLYTHPVFVQPDVRMCTVCVVVFFCFCFFATIASSLSKTKGQRGKWMNGLFILAPSLRVELVGFFKVFLTGTH